MYFENFFFTKLIDLFIVFHYNNVFVKAKYFLKL